LITQKETLDKHADTLHDEVKIKITAVDTALSVREAELLQQVGRIKQTKKTQLMETTEDLHNMAKSLTTCIEEMESALSKSDPYDFLEAAAAVEVSLFLSLSLSIYVCTCISGSGCGGFR